MRESIIIIEHTGMTKKEKLQIRRFLRKMKKEREENGAERLRYFIGGPGKAYSLADFTDMASEKRGEENDSGI